MNNEKREFLNLRHLPARLTQEETGWFLGFSTREIPTLTRARLLKPLGNPTRFSHKFYATVELLEVRDDVRWLHKATATIFKFWQDANGTNDEKTKPPRE